MKKIYVYVDGSDLDEVFDTLVDRFSAFAETWGVGSAQVVNDKWPRNADLDADDLPQWDLGLNFETELLSNNELDRLLLFLSKTAAETGREFAIGGCLTPGGCSEDLAFIGSDIGNDTLQVLRGLLVRPAKRH